VSAPVRPSSCGLAANAVTHNGMQTAAGFDLRITPGPAAAAPQLPSSRERVYLPQPSAPLPPGVSPFMGALSGYFATSPPVPGANKPPSWQPAHPQALNLQLPLEWRPLTVSAPPVAVQHDRGERSKGPARLTGFADRPAARTAQLAASHPAGRADGSAAAGAAHQADTDLSERYAC
jgi:hypothetical protein